jgi:Protein of unknown function (DUF4058)
MPILDHFSPPLSVARVWNTFHHAWSATIARLLNRRLLPENYFAAPNVQFGARIEIDVGTFEASDAPANHAASAAFTLAAQPETVVIPVVFPDTVEVVILQQEGGSQVVVAIELVSPNNKDRPATRRAFVAKMSSYLQQGTALSVIDLVTTRAAHLHNEWIQWMQAPTGQMADVEQNPLYANSYRPVQHGGRAEIEMWLNPLRVGDPLPTLPLFLRSDLCIEIPFEETYLETCEDQRIPLTV